MEAPTCENADCSATSDSNSSNQVLFLLPLGADSTPRDRELQQAEAKSHAATISHKRKLGLRSKDQGVSLENDPSNPPNEAGGPRTNLKAESPAPATLIGLRGYEASSYHIHGPTFQASLRPRLQTVNFPRANTIETLTALAYHGETDPRVQQSPISGEAKGFKHEESLETITHIAKKNSRQARSILTKTRLPRASVHHMSHGHSTSFSRAIEYFMQVLVPNNTPVYTIFEVSNVNCSYFLQIIEASQAQYLGHSVLALLHLVIGQVAPQTNSRRRALQHTGAAISLLQKLISERGDENDDDAAFMAVVCLASFSRAVGDSVGYSVHRNRLAQMIKSRGGLDNTGFQGFIKALTLQFAPPECVPLSLCFSRPFRGSIVDPTDPFFHDTRVQKPDLPPSYSLDADLSAIIARLPPGFQSLIFEVSISMSTTELLCRIMNASTRRDQEQGLKRKENRSSDDRWKVSRYSDFWECCPSICHAGPDLEKYLCLSLLLYTANEFAPDRAFHNGMALYGGPRALLAAEIGLLSHLKLTPAQRACWMWIWWVAIDSWSEADIMTDTGTLLMSQFWAMFPEVQGWSGLHSVLELFFWGGKFEAAIRRLVDGTATALE